MNKYLVFVYGSLKHGFMNHRLLSDRNAKLLGAAQSIAPSYAMLDFGTFPGLIEGHQRVHGEVYEITQDNLDILDALEGHPYMYERKKTRFVLMDDKKVVEAWVYIYKPGNHPRTKLPECVWKYKLHGVDK